YLKQPSPTTSLVLVGGSEHKPDQAMATKATHVVCDAPSADALVSWITARGRQIGIDIDGDAAKHLVRSVAGSLSLAAVELEKISVAVDPGSRIGVADLERYVGIRHGETMWDWVDRALYRDTNQAIRLLEVVLPQPGITGVKLVTALGTALVGTRMTRGLMDGGRTPKQVEDALWKFLKAEKPRGIGRYSEEIKRWLGAAKRWPGRELDDAIELLYNTDQRLKSGSIGDERAVLTNTLLHFRAL
ncbi:MAG: hypothetical protein OEZ54_07905, partial [Gemmatimonadota bacterium]|nr:hypothetical protein [Gemmatimonadota bacterium]